jgi:hypothetical protein
LVPRDFLNVIYLTVTNVILALIVVGLVVALLLERKAMAELLAHFEVMHQEERARFLAAVQRPDQIQPVHQPKPLSKDEIERRQRQAQNLALVGTVSHAEPKD